MYPFSYNLIGSAENSVNFEGTGRFSDLDIFHWTMIVGGKIKNTPLEKLTARPWKKGDHFILERKGCNSSSKFHHVSAQIIQSYFTNLDFPEIKGPISNPKSYVLGAQEPVFWSLMFGGDLWLLVFFGKVFGSSTFWAAFLRPTHCSWEN